MFLVRIVVVAISLGMGMIGLVMPILPGWLFFGVAALILFPDWSISRKARAAIDARWPRTGRWLRALQKRG